MTENSEEETVCAFYFTPNYVAKTETCSTAILKSAGKTQLDALKGFTESMLGGESAPS